MALGRKRRSRANEEGDVDVDMVPVMNMFLVLIPFLLISANFINLRVINTAVPVLSQEVNKEIKPEKKIKRVTVVVELQSGRLKLSALSDNVAVEELKGVDAILENRIPGKYPLDLMAAHLKSVKRRFPLSDTLILIPGEEVLYDAIIEVMDVARFVDKEPLFPNMVLSGKV